VARHSRSRGPPWWRPPHAGAGGCASTSCRRFDSGLRLALETDARQLDAAAAAPGARLWIRPERLFVFARA
jgi:hypothetical protein